jgi:hypothetical protein
MLWSDAEGLLFVVMMESKGLVVGRRCRWIYRDSILFPSGISLSLALPSWWGRPWDSDILKLRRLAVTDDQYVVVLVSVRSAKTWIARGRPPGRASIEGS